MELKETTFLGIEINNTPSGLIKKALGASIKHLSMENFMEVIEFKKDPVMTDYFWQVMVQKQHSHLSSLLLQCLGYEGKGFTQQQAIKRFLKSNNIQPLELSSDDPRVEAYDSIKEEMKVMKPNVIANRKWLIIEPREFKKVIMKLNTKNGDNIREYYIRLEELIKSYLEYSLHFKEREAQIEKERSTREICDLKQLMDQMKIDSDRRAMLAEERHDELLDKVEEVQYDLNIVGEKLEVAVEDRSPKVKAELLRERFIIFNRHDPRSKAQYYVMRGQDHYINGKLPSYKNIHPHLEVIFDISCQPNPRNLFVRFKELKDQRFRVIGNNIQTTEEDALLEVFNMLNDDKRNVQLA
jgi:MSV199 domain/Protein of unknown function (DUF3627)